MRNRCLDHLTALVAFDTTNPPREPLSMRRAIDAARSTLEAAGFACDVTDLGDGCFNLLALRGRATTLVNCHLDTVPACQGWDGDPWTLRIENDTAIGLGACDIKGAAAAILTAAERTTGEAAILLTTDEEAGRGYCVNGYLEECDARERFARVIVSEPTGCRVVTEHRGFISVEASFSGTAGHASAGTSGARSAVHDALRWGAAALEWSDASRDESRLAIGVIEGGVKSNMIAQSARVRFGIRNRPTADADAALAQLRSLANGSLAHWTERFRGPALGTTTEAASIAALLGAELAEPVDYWTEAALFAQAGIPSVVFGPGSIAQAHAANEHVPIADLERAVSCLTRLFSGPEGVNPS
ncbi:MAG: acetylornithine deacetylase [Phycisphaeraceae bacterium]|nr:acetylornithine deacetylase [Phycisphaeraceae bacterium]MCB9848659.1 acetylornithine deacetylase [Phycisphaeraceae bacterium]